MGTDKERRKHLAIVCRSCGGSGSVASVAVHQAIALAAFFDVTLISDTFPEAASTVTFDRIAPPAFHWLRRYGHAPRELAFARHARGALERLVRSKGVDFVLCHAHTVAALSATLLDAAAVPYGLVTHGDIFDRPKGTYDPLLTQLYKATTPRAYRRASLIVALSPHMAELAKLHGASPPAIALIPNGVDKTDIGLDDDYVPPPQGGPLHILYVGRLAAEKGVDVLIAACTRLRAREIAFALHLAGDGPLQSHLKQSVAAADLTDTARFLGPVSRKGLGRLYHWSHIVCVPSLSDSLPTVALEAFASGRAVVGTNVGGLPYIVDEGRTGLLVERGSPDALAAALERFAASPGLAETMGRAAHREATERFSWASTSAQLAEAIGQAIAAPLAMTKGRT